MTAVITLESLLNLPGIHVLKVEEDKSQNILIYLETSETFMHCRLCKAKITKRHGTDRERKVRHLSVFGKHTYIIYQPHRYICENCDDRPTTTATPNWHSSHSAYTNAYENHILLELVNSTLADVAIKEKITEESVQGILNRLIETGIDWPGIDWPGIDYLGILGIDEIALKKGQRDYVTIISSRVEGKLRLIAVLNGHKKATIKGFLKHIPKRLKKTVEAICVDIYEGHLNAAKEVFKQTAIIVVDRYHVAKLYRNGVDKFRQKVIRQLKQELPASAYEKIKGATLLLRKNNECILPKEKAILNELFSYSPELMEAYRQALELTQLFNTHLSKQQALSKLDEWMRLVKQSELACFNKFIKTLKKWKNEIANYFIDRNTSGFVEGLNNKVKVLKRRCYGIFNIKHLFQRLHLDISGYDILLGNLAF